MRPQGDQRGLEEFSQRAELPERFKPVGRLDQDSTGLLLWTDDGALAEELMRPSSGVWKTYEVTLASRLGRGLERTLAEGSIVLDGRPVRRCRVFADPESGRRRLIMELHEGRKRQIRRMVAAVGNRVVALKRLAIGPVELGRLRAGDFRRLSHDEEQALRQAVQAGKEQ
jgi:23S rRNA pseudouridine2605 synthase